MYKYITEDQRTTYWLLYTCLILARLRLASIYFLLNCFFLNDFKACKMVRPKRVKPRSQDELCLEFIRRDGDQDGLFIVRETLEKGRPGPSNGIVCNAIILFLTIDLIKTAHHTYYNLSTTLPKWPRPTYTLVFALLAFQLVLDCSLCPIIFLCLHVWGRIKKWK